MYVYVRGCARVCARACVRACVHVCVCGCPFVFLGLRGGKSESIWVCAETVIARYVCTVLLESAVNTFQIQKILDLKSSHSVRTVGFVSQVISFGLEDKASSVMSESVRHKIFTFCCHCGLCLRSSRLA